MVIKCKMCGGDLSFEEGSSVCECEYCGSRQTLPNVDNEKKGNLFNRANRLRMNSEFDKASAVYESIAAEFPEEAEAYWGLCLCAYGIEYVDDPATGKKLPTCHRTLPTSIMEDENFEQACDNADSIARKVYRDEAKAIDRIQKDILAIAANEAPYDVFICYKETAEDGGRTPDSVLAQDIYDALTAKGLKVFFSRITLEDKLGVQYEPYIYAALSSAKVMIAVGTQFEYYDAVWVKNEWSRFLGMMRTDKTKTLIPCFKDLDAYDMPKEFKGLQAQDMGKLGWMQDLVRGVEKLCGKGRAVQQTAVREVLQSGSNAENLMKRVYLFLEDGDFEQAREYIGKVLDTDAEYAPAYVANVLAQYKLRNESALNGLRNSIDDNADWKKALRFADEKQKQVYDGYARTVNGNEAYDCDQKRIKAEQERMARIGKVKEVKYCAAVSAMRKKSYAAAIIGFKSIGDYRDSYEKMKTCIDAYRIQLQDEKLKEGNTNPRLVAVQKKAAEIQQNIQRIQHTISDMKKQMETAVKREKEIPDQIKQLSNELGQIRGLFSGGKKRELESRIEALKMELQNVTATKQKCETSMKDAKHDLADAEAELRKANAENDSVNTELRKAALITWSDEDVASAARVAYIAQFEVGKTVTMGSYGSEDVEWLVLAADGDKRTMIAVKGQEAVCFNKSNSDGNQWENSYIRTWLNDIYYSSVFSSEEQAMIVSSPTEDKVRLLSVEEAKQYFTNDEARICVPTDHAKKNGAYTNDNGAGWWWLRSPGSYSDYAAVVRSDGYVDASGYGVSLDDEVARPVVVVALGF